MSEQLGSILLWLIIFIPFGIFVRQIQQVRRGVRSKAKGTSLFFCLSLIPILVYILIFFVLIGIEEVTNSTLIGEELSRTFAFVVGISITEVLLLTAIFAISVWLIRVTKGAT